MKRHISSKYAHVPGMHHRLSRKDISDRGNILVSSGNTAQIHHIALWPAREVKSVFNAANASYIHPSAW